MFVLFFALDLRQKSYLRLENQKFLCLRIFWTADLGVRNKLRPQTTFMIANKQEQLKLYSEGREFPVGLKPVQRRQHQCLF